jgi:hypothetical protein
MPFLRKKGIEFATAGVLPPDRDLDFLGGLIPSARGAARLNRYHEAMGRIKGAQPQTLTVAGG